jgi:hypothetical protein
MRRDNPFEIMTRLPVGRPRNRGLIYWQEQEIFASVQRPGRLWGPLFPLWQLITHPHQAPTLMRGATIASWGAV